MHVVVIGGSGHIGSFLIPRLVRAGHEVTTITRGTSTAYTAGPEWDQVRRVIADREQEDEDGIFAARVRDLRPDTVIDLVCFTLDSARALVEGLRGHVGHLISCGSVWRYGPTLKLPIREGEGTPAIDDYGTQKEAIALYLKAETAAGGLSTTTLHPGHISGPGWAPIGPLGNLDPAVWSALSVGETLRIPGSGAESMHHVHADDVAQAFELATARRDAAAGEDFHVVAPSALTVRGFAQIAAGWFGQEAVLESVGWEEFRRGTSDDHAAASWGHLHRSQYFSIEKAVTLLGYAPRYEPEAAVLEAVLVMLERGELTVPGELAARLR
ncbi:MULTISPECIES: NAD-dependent epimerase/dehydratase family protein [unclassified Rathayibacter]|uniref:NAD-dependent epimerase/dehydratase family protein n=1 Tax=unclassified Rathayibacter TaxID=2609250 RepID=UPI0007007405|nr:MULTISPECIES: NAD(P)-dependent oxidoreductase [unclassified Rathayibacter]KQQ03381.1 epimerase [Rathayibacter sp. Leaf294]KQS11836.1 epimerase [Rathayibacter sp. Leaf185]